MHGVATVAKRSEDPGGSAFDSAEGVCVCVCVCVWVCGCVYLREVSAFPVKINDPVVRGEQ